MLNLGSIRLIKREIPNSFAFVGVRMHPTEKVPEFWLPQGFQAFPDSDYESTVRTFFMLYKVMRKFAARARLRPDLGEPRREAFEIREEGFAYDPSTSE